MVCNSLCICEEHEQALHFPHCSNKLEVNTPACAIRYQIDSTIRHVIDGMMIAVYSDSS
jgi:hypothetical protein